MAGRQNGATLVEMVMFIAIMGVVIGGLVVAFTNSVKSAPQSKLMTEGLELAKERLELIRGQRKRLGFSGFSGAPTNTYDPCLTGSTHPSCSDARVTHCFYTGASVCAFGSTTTCFAANTDYKCARVRVTISGVLYAELDEAFGNF
jgi:hypothetical protein